MIERFKTRSIFNFIMGALVLLMTASYADLAYSSPYGHDLKVFQVYPDGKPMSQKRYFEYDGLIYLGIVQIGDADDISIWYRGAKLRENEKLRQQI